MILKYWKLILIVLLFIAVCLTFNTVISLRRDNQRLKSNMENITAENQRELTLRRNEYKQLNTVWKDKLDSVLKDNKIKLRNLQAATIIQTAYKDTAKKPVVYGAAVAVDDSTSSDNPVLVQQYYKIPVQQISECWGMIGYINSTDVGSQLEITERTSTNSIQLIVIRKRFLGFLWHNGKTDYKAFSDCGQLDITKIDFKK